MSDSDSSTSTVADPSVDMNKVLYDGAISGAVGAAISYMAPKVNSAAGEGGKTKMQKALKAGLYSAGASVIADYLNVGDYVTQNVSQISDPAYANAVAEGAMYSLLLLMKKSQRTPKKVFANLLVGSGIGLVSQMGGQYLTNNMGNLGMGSEKLISKQKKIGSTLPPSKEPSSYYNSRVPGY